MKKRTIKAHEVTTVICSNGIGNKTMDKYIIIAPTTSEAISAIPLRDGEEVLRAEELRHKVIVKR